MAAARLVNQYITTSTQPLDFWSNVQLASSFCPALLFTDQTNAARKKPIFTCRLGKGQVKSIHETSFSTSSSSVHPAVSVCHVTSCFCFSACFIIAHQKAGFSERDGIWTKCGNCGSECVWVSAQTFALFKVCLVGVLKHLKLAYIKIGPVPCKVKQIKYSLVVRLLTSTQLYVLSDVFEL